MSDLSASNVEAGTSLRRLPETDIDTALAAQLARLLGSCFEEYPGRSYFKLPPHLRYVVESEDRVVAQMGVELRMVRVGAEVLRTLGLVDLCVDPAQRSRGLAGRLLGEVTAFGAQAGVAFIVLFADDDRLYRRQGWSSVANTCSWLQINDHTTMGLAERENTGALMVKAIGDRAWPDGDVDLLGHLF